MTVKKNPKIIRKVNPETLDLRNRILKLVKENNGKFCSRDIYLILTYGKRERPKGVLASDDVNKYNNICYHLNKMKDAGILKSKDTPGGAPIMKKVWRLVK